MDHLDRIDLHVEVPRLQFEKLSKDQLAESSAKIRERVEQAREKQKNRFVNTNITSNSEMSNKEIREFCKLDTGSMDLLKQAVTHMASIS